jgi:hypothetical protein
LCSVDFQNSSLQIFYCSKGEVCFNSKTDFFSSKHDPSKVT